jgi:hypothetical protein
MKFDVHNGPTVMLIVFRVFDHICYSQGSSSGWC